MIPFSDIAGQYIYFFQFIEMLLIIAQLYILINAFSMRRSVPYRVFTVIQLVCGLLMFSALLDGTYTVSYADRVRTYPFLVTAVYSAPWLVAAAAELVQAVLAVVCVIDIRRFSSENPSGESIKEAVDMLPVGICFFKPDGTVALKNLFMEDLSIKLSGRPLNDATAFWDMISSKGEESGDSVFLAPEDSGAFRFTRETVTLADIDYTLLLAYDITEQYGITADLKTKNKKLLDIRLRMKMFGGDIKRLAMSEEILKARVTVHDEVGHVLLSGRYYLDHPDSVDGAGLIRLMQYTNRLLTREGEEPDDAKRDAYTEALIMAETIGVKLSVTGEPPESGAARELFGRAVRECAANTVKHSGGDNMSVEFITDNARVTAIIRSGSEAASQITETGGLLLLRRSVESAGGVMTVEPSPCVTVTVTLPISSARSAG